MSDLEKNNTNPHNKKSFEEWIGVILLSLCGIFVLLVFMGAFSSEKQPPININPELSAPEKSIDRQISDLIEPALEGNNAKIVGDVELMEKRNGYQIILDFNIGDYLSANSAKHSIERTMTDVYYNLYKNISNISVIDINAHMSLMDGYGNSSDSIVYA